MRKNNLFVLATLCVATLAFEPSSVSAQTTNAPSPGSPMMAPGATPGAPRGNPAMRNLMSIRGALASMDRVIADLQRNENDFEGHRQAAIDACTKARAELAEIAKQAGIPLPPKRGTPGMMQRPVGVPPPANAPAGTPPVQSPPPQ